MSLGYVSLDSFSLCPVRPYFSPVSESGARVLTVLTVPSIFDGNESGGEDRSKALIDCPLTVPTGKATAPDVRRVHNVRFNRLIQIRTIRAVCWDLE